jgi:hypothetical protein
MFFPFHLLRNNKQLKKVTKVMTLVGSRLHRFRHGLQHSNPAGRTDQIAGEVHKILNVEAPNRSCGFLINWECNKHCRSSHSWAHATISAGSSRRKILRANLDL